MYELTISTAFRYYNDHCKSCGVKESSIKINQYAQGYLCNYLEEKLDIADATISQLDRYLLRNYFIWLQEEQGLSASTAQRSYDVLKALFNFLVDEELIEKSPMAKVAKPKREPHAIKPLTTEQVQAMVDSCDGTTFTGLRNKLTIAILFDTGMRAGELTAIDIEDVDLDERKILIRHTKTGVPRFTYYSSTVAKLLSKYLILRSQNNLSDRLIVTDEGQEVERYWLGTMIKRVGKKAGLKVHPHLLRHSCAVASLKNGSDVASVMRLLGHSNPRMTLHYSQLADKDVQEIHSRTSPADKLNISKGKKKRKK